MPIGKRTDQNSDNSPNENIPAAASKSESKKDETIIFQAETPKYTFDDIILNPETYDTIQDLLTIVNKRELIFDTWGLGAAHKQQNKAGINLYGESGTGKSMAAHAIANQLQRKLLIVDYSQIESRYVGDTAKNLVAMFKQAKTENAIILTLTEKYDGVSGSDISNAVLRAALKTARKNEKAIK